MRVPARSIIAFGALIALGCLLAPAPASADVIHSPLEIAPGSSDWGPPYGPAQASREGDIVVLSGVIRTGGALPRVVATLPVGTRPPGTLTFWPNKDAGGLRVDVHPSGAIEVISGNLGGWVSLDGIVFSIGAGEALSPTPAFANFGRGFASARATRQGNLVTLAGLLHTPSLPGRITTLPPALRPPSRQAFVVAGGPGSGGAHEPVRIDIEPDGAVTWISGGPIEPDRGVPPQGEFRIWALGSGRFMRTNELNGGLVSTLDQANDHYAFILEPSTGGSVRIKVKATGRYLHAFEIGDRLVSTRYATNDDDSRFIFVRIPGYGWRVKVKATGRWLREDAFGDRLLSTREASAVTYDLNSRFRLEPTSQPLHDDRRWLSLSGITYTTSAGDPVVLGPGYSDYQGDGFGPARIERAGGFAVLSGLLNGLQAGPVLTLPEGYRPDTSRIFNGLGGSVATRLDLGSDGLLGLRHGGQSGGWLTLTGVVFALPPSDVPPADLQPLPLAPGVEDWGGYQRASVAEDGGIVRVGGLIRVEGATRHLATLPVGMRPPGRLVFNVLAGDRMARVDVLPSGVIQGMHARPTSWLSLDGIRFATAPGAALQPDAPWQAGSGFQPPQLHRIGDRVLLSGVIAAPGGLVRPILTLPPEHRPPMRQAMLIAGNDANARIDVMPSGELLWMSGQPSEAWLSLSGIEYAVTAGADLSLDTGWSTYGNGFGPAQVHVDGDRVLLSGLIRGVRQGTVLTLPPHARPVATRTFNRESDLLSTRVQIDPDGRVHVVTGGVAGSWLSLAGAAFTRGAVTAPAVHVEAEPPPPAVDGLPARAWAAMGELPKLGDLITALPAPDSVDAQSWQATAQLGDLEVTVYVYVPSGRLLPNVAVMAEKLRLSQLIEPVSDTALDELIVTDATFLFVPSENAGAVQVADLPEPVRTQVEKVRTGEIELFGSENVFARIHLDNDGEVEGVLADVGICSDDDTAECFERFAVHAAHGNSDQVQKRFLRVTHQGDWVSPFRLDDVVLTDPTMEFLQVSSKRLVRAWGTVQIPATREGDDPSSWFLFGQCVLKTCKAQNAFAINAASASLEDVKDVIAVLGEATFGEIFGTGPIDDLMDALSHLPLHRIAIENADYDEDNNLVDGNPDFDQKMLLVTASAGQTLPYTSAAEMTGPLIKAYGEGVAFGVPVGNYDVYAGIPGGILELDVTGTIGGFDWGPLTLGDIDFGVQRAGDTYGMHFSATASVGDVIDESITISADNDGFDYSVPANCPWRPFSIDARLDVDLTGVTSFTLGDGTFAEASVDADFGCLPDILGEIVDVAKKALSVGADAAGFTTDLFAGLGFPVNVLEDIYEFDFAGQGLQGFQERVHVALTDADRTFVRAGQVYGQAAEFAGQSVTDALGAGWAYGEGVFERLVHGGGDDPPVVNFLPLGWPVLASGIQPVSGADVPAQCGEESIRIGGGNTDNLARLNGVSADVSAQILPVVDCEEIVIGRGEQGVWWRLDLGTDEAWHIKGVFLHNEGGTAADAVGGLDGAYVMLSQHDDLLRALSDLSVEYPGDASQAYPRVHKLGAQPHHYVIPGGECQARRYECANFVDIDKALTASRYIWIYQPRTDVPLKLEQVSVVGFKVTDWDDMTRRCTTDTCNAALADAIECQGYDAICGTE